MTGINKRHKLWYSIIKYIEATQLRYNSGSNLVGFWLPSLLRKLASNYARDNTIIIDVGVGPGSMSKEILLKTVNSYIVGIDVSMQLSLLSKYILSRWSERYDCILACAEHIPIRSSSINLVYTSFSYRDVLDYIGSMKEFARILRSFGNWISIDMGKPHKKYLRKICGVLILLSSMIFGSLISLSIKNNPWKKLVITYLRSISNEYLIRLTKKLFKRNYYKEFFFGIAYIIIAIK